LENFIITIAGTVIAAIIVGLPALAFKKPDFYEEFIGNKPYYLLAFFIIGYLSWAVGAEMTIRSLTTEQLKLESDSLNKIKDYTSATAITVSQLVVGICYVYLEGLIGGILRHHKFKSLSVKK